MNQFVTIKDIANLLNCSTKTVRRKVDKGVIPAIQPDGPGTLLRFEVGEVLRAIKSPSEPSEAEAQTVSLVTPSKRKQKPPAGSNDKKLSGPIPKWERTVNQSYRER